MFRIITCCIFFALLPLPLVAAAQNPTLEVLHWWTSAGEVEAAAVLKQGLAERGVSWQDYPVPGGGGDSAMAVLKARVINGSPPGAAQIIGPNIQYWAGLGFLQPLSNPSLAADGLFYPVVDDLIRVDQDVVAVPLSIHRINWMWLNPAVFERLELPLPTTWSQLLRAAPRLREAGVVPLAHGNQPWQNATLFEVLLLSEAGPEFYQRYFVEQDPAVLEDARVVATFERLRQLKSLMDPAMINRSWQDASRMVADGEAAAQIMGDWVKGAFTAWGLHAGEDYLCLAVPGTNEQHLYSIDTFVQFRDNPSPISFQPFIETLLAPQVQRDFSLAKGTIPVRRDLTMAGFDDCSRASHHVFNQAAAEHRLAPSMAHSMATSPETEDAVFEIVHRFFIDDSVSPQAATAQLAQSLRALK
ncbi:ABC transporter substrate-binding protein [Saccharospirillum sp. HFRX-1]|uniref:ABC transporter substrate-binding protein n=1 Tax=unclassified Saccharospirillum TaxID=2633430 RepID=UPI00371C99C1